MSEADRRPLASRNTSWARALARHVAASGVTPNQISGFSIVAAALAGLCFWLAGADGPGPRPAWLLAAALLCQLRLLCNLVDGMVAIEAGKSAPDGQFWNEFPDRLADILILVGVGLCVGLPALGWAAATAAVLTAYMRELARALHAPADFSGPMAKPHRMAVVTAAALIAMFEPLWGGNQQVLSVALWIVAAGSAVTVLRRAVRLRAQLRRDV